MDFGSIEYFFSRDDTVVRANEYMSVEAPYQPLLIATPTGIRCGRPTFSIVTKAHLGLAQADGIFPLADTIKLFKLCLVHTLGKRVSSECSDG